MDKYEKEEKRREEAKKEEEALQKRWQEFQALADRKDSLWELCGDFILRNNLTIDMVSTTLGQDAAVTFVEMVCSIRNPSK